MSSLPPTPTRPDVPAAAAQRAEGPAARPSSRWAPLRWVARLSVGLVITSWCVLLVAWLALHWAILPHIDEWRGALEARAERALGVPVAIGRIEVRSSGWVPSFELHDVVLLDTAKRPALRLPRVFAAISPRSLLSLQLRFEQVLIDGAQLEVRRDAAGRIHVAGLDMSGDDAGQGSAASNWFFAQHEFVIRGGSLRWTDEQRSAPPLALTDVQFVVRNGLRQHDVRFDATPPAEWGERFGFVGRFTQPLLARRGDWQRWSGTAHASFPRADVQALRQHLSLPFELSEGVGALRGWVDVNDGQPTAATIDVALRAVTLKLGATTQPLAVEEVQGRLVGRRDAEGTSVTLSDFGFRTGDSLVWPKGDLSLAWRQRAGQPATGGRFSAEHLDLGLLAQIAARVPIGESLREVLAELNPKAAVDDLSLTWEGPVDAPERYRTKARLSGLSLASKPAPDAPGLGRPGLRNAALTLEASETGGEARLEIAAGAIDLPGVFDEPLVPLDRFSAQLLWKVEPAGVSGGAGAAGAAGASGAAGALPKLTLQVKDARFANADAKGELSAFWSSGAGTGFGRGGRFPGRLELDGKLSGGVAARTHRYLPTALSRPLRQYLERAVQGGRIADAGFHVKGDLFEFPFFEPPAARAAGTPGEFRFSAKVDDATFAYLPGTPTHASSWPALTQVGVELALDRNTLELRNGRARIGGVEVQQAHGAIRNLGREAVVSIDANAQGPLAEMLQFVRTTPVGGWTGNVLDAATGAGTAGLALALAIPLADPQTTSVKGSVTLAGNDVRIAPETPLLGQAAGRVDFSHKGFAVVGATAKLFGGDAAFDGGLQADGSVRFAGQGTLSAENLRRATGLGPVPNVATALSGQAAYRASLAFVGGQPEITVTSNLVGLGSSLPAPLAKAPDAPLALRYQTTPDPASTPAARRDTLRFELGSVVQAQYLRDLSGAAPRVLRGGIGVFEPAPQPASGVAASVTLPALATDPWDAAYEKLFGGAPEARDGGVRGTAPSPAGADASAGYVPDTIGLRVQELTAGQRRLTRVAAGLSQVGGVWRANVDADQLDGYLEYRPPSRRGATGAATTATSGGRVYARLSRLSLPKSDVEQVESLLDQQPSSLPALDVVVDDFELRGKRLGRVEIEAVNRSTGPARDAARDWELSKFNITTPEARFIGTGRWAAAEGVAAARGAAPRRSVIDFRLQLADSGALLARLGTPNAVRGGKGELSGQVAWLGSPFSIDYPSLAGQVKVAIDAGQFLKADAGAARLLSVLSLQSLPRRLSLDFRDVFQEGFAFDSVSGDLTIDRGVAQTNNLRMRGVQALVLMEGSADIAREAQDLRVVVVPEINAGTAALAYAVINPAVGLGAFLAQVLLRKPLMEAGTREFHVSGAWAEPKVERVDRKYGDALPSGEAPATVPPSAPAAVSAPAPAPTPGPP